MTSRSELPRGSIERGLYALADVEAADRAGLNLIDCARAMIAAEVSVVQARAKPWGAGQLVKAGRQLMSESGGRTVVVINDRVDVAELIGAPGVHVGQDDLPPSMITTDTAVGLSTHNDEQLRQALAMDRLDYVALGPIFATTSKRNADPVVGLLGLCAAYARTSQHELPLVAIGGITRDRVPSVARHCDLVAAISLLYPEPGVSSPYSWMEKRCRELDGQIQATEPDAA